MKVNISAETTTRQEANAEAIGTSTEQGKPLSPPSKRLSFSKVSKQNGDAFIVI